MGHKMKWSNLFGAMHPSINMHEFFFGNRSNSTQTHREFMLMLCTLKKGYFWMPVSTVFKLCDTIFCVKRDWSIFVRLSYILCAWPLFIMFLTLLNQILQGFYSTLDGLFAFGLLCPVRLSFIAFVLARRRVQILKILN